MRARAHRSLARSVDHAGCALLALGFLWLAGSSVVDASAREEGPAKKAHRSQPARTAQAAPDRTGSIERNAPMRPAAVASAPITAPAVPSDSDDGALVPVTLPNVPRSRMVSCGETWRTMKMNGATGDDSWRDFALKCLVAKDASAP